MIRNTQGGGIEGVCSDEESATEAVWTPLDEGLTPDEIAHLDTLLPRDLTKGYVPAEHRPYEDTSDMVLPTPGGYAAAETARVLRAEKKQRDGVDRSALGRVGVRIMSRIRSSTDTLKQ